MQNLKYSVVLMALCALFLCDAETHNITYPQPKCGGKEKASTLLDVAKDFMNKAKSLYPECIDDDLNCGKKEKSLAFLEVASNLVLEAKKAFPTCRDSEYPDRECPKQPECPECPEKPERPMDCFEILQTGKNESGVYTIWPRKGFPYNQPLTVYCDMDTDGGGWTIIQRRGNFSTPKDYFYKDWESYKAGFGDIKEEFWLGNDNINSISSQVRTSIRFDLEDAKGVPGYAHYDSFWIEDEKSAYTLHIRGYNGTVGDAMKLNNNMKFSTKDRKNDQWPSSGSCSEDRKGGWWYEHCGLSNLNGLYQPGIDAPKGIRWYQWRNDISLAKVEIKLRHERIQ